MNLRLIFKIYAGLNAFFIIPAVLAPEAMMEGYGLIITEEIRALFNFLLGLQLMFVLVTWQLPEWLGDNLSKAGPTYVVIVLIPFVQGLYMMSNGSVPASTQGYIESAIYAVFACLFYYYSQDQDNSMFASEEEEEF
jgi:hypothetical protein